MLVMISWCTAKIRRLHYLYTMWKFLDFSVTQILRQINCEDSSSVKSAILTHLGALNFYEYLHFLKTKIYQIDKI